MLHFRGKVTFSHCLSVTCFRQSNRTERPPRCDPHDEYSRTEPDRLIPVLDKVQKEADFDTGHNWTDCIVLD